MKRKTVTLRRLATLTGCTAVLGCVASFIQFSGPWGFAQQSRAANLAEEPSAMLAHNVYFSLKDPSPETRSRLIGACHKYLSQHPGTVFYAAGTLSDLDREVNDRDFDVGLHIIFKDRAAHDQYQVSPLHLKFIAENKDLWKGVRVFDSDVAAAGK